MSAVRIRRSKSESAIWTSRDDRLWRVVGVVRGGLDTKVMLELPVGDLIRSAKSLGQCFTGSGAEACDWAPAALSQPR